jgi:hypothetical protein
MMRFALKWMPFEERKFVYPQVSTTKEYENLSSYDRFYLDTHAENSLVYRLPISDGYDPLYYSRYGEFMKYVSSGIKSPGERSLIIFPKDGKYSKKALDILGIRYVAYRVSDARAPWAFPYWTYPDGQLKEVYTDGKYTVFNNTNALPKAYAVDSVINGNSDDGILKEIFRDDFHSSQSAVIESSNQIVHSEDKRVGEVEVVSYKNNSVELSTNLYSENLVILNDVLYPGWKVYVDAKESQIERVNYIFRGVIAPSGKHTIKFEYKPDSFKYGLIFAGLGIIGIFGLGIIQKKYAKKK